MSTFLGNLDVNRFVSDASEADGVCGEVACGSRCARGHGLTSDSRSLDRAYTQPGCR